MDNKVKLSDPNANRNLPFTVPDHYFVQFAEQMDVQIGYKKYYMRKIFKPWYYAVAAVLVGVAVLSPVMYNKIQPVTTNNTASYESYVLTQVDESAMMDCYVDDQTANNK